MTTPVLCVDLSSYQKGFDFAAFRANGGVAVILKATEGTSIRDSCYKTFRAEALAAGLKVASYHFFRSSDPKAQADYYFNFAEPVAGERVICDFEDNTTTVANLVAFLQRLQSKGQNLQLTVYSGGTIKDQLGTKPNAWLKANTSLWLAEYTTGEPSWPTQVWPEWSLWQYSAAGRVPGFSGAVDCNRFNGPDAQLLKWMGPAIGEPMPRQRLVAAIASGSQFSIDGRTQAILFGVIAGLSIIAAASPSVFPSYLSPEAGDIIKTAAGLNTLISGIASVMGLYSSNNPGPLAPPDAPEVVQAKAVASIRMKAQKDLRP